MCIKGRASPWVNRSNTLRPSKGKSKYNSLCFVTFALYSSLAYLSPFTAGRSYLGPLGREIRPLRGVPLWLMHPTLTFMRLAQHVLYDILAQKLCSVFRWTRQRNRRFSVLAVPHLRSALTISHLSSCDTYLTAPRKTMYWASKNLVSMLGLACFATWKGKTGAQNPLVFR